ncbi:MULTISPECIES: TM2 domain-containing protein [unclassified Nocardioides]|jgi:TM2 domain-containing membrane protein YozV|uniref:TM2 domain-containing protein n=1 Tax=unclassified Nocardioides TaxID=2615069 RepID=UPI000702FB31|nr:MULTISPECIES: TM2 domain-containing protein [unclassified Nocardioides]KRC57700.1 hypothetical protein ASE19_23350 [Nocardioides sp. Root79]KRC74903.1 hypothetical protein ASE20_23310 [Nocardioides sp. Root240]
MSDSYPQSPGQDPHQPQDPSAQGQPTPPPYGAPPPQGAPSPYQPYGAPGPTGYGFSPAAPWGVDPVTGVPYSEKQKVVAGVLQILLPFGIGRFYIGDTGTGIAQLLVSLVTCGIGGIWSMIDGILLLTGRPTDSEGRPLR